MQLSNIIIAAVIIVLAVVFLVWRNNHYDYHSEKCGNKIHLSLGQAAFSPKAMGRKMVKCPRCGSTGWVSPVPK